MESTSFGGVNLGRRTRRTQPGSAIAATLQAQLDPRSRGHRYLPKVRATPARGVQLPVLTSRHDLSAADPRWRPLDLVTHFHPERRAGDERSGRRARGDGLPERLTVVSRRSRERGPRPTSTAPDRRGHLGTRAHRPRRSSLLVIGPRRYELAHRGCSRLSAPPGRSLLRRASPVHPSSTPPSARNGALCPTNPPTELPAPDTELPS